MAACRKATSNRISGFSLVELLVVIAIIAVLIGMLLPAVQQARQAAYTTQSMNNLKQMALASQNYENVNGYVIPYSITSVDFSNSTLLYRTGDYYSLYNYFCSLLPYIEEGNLANAFLLVKFNGDGSTFNYYYAANLTANLGSVPVVKTYVNPSDPSLPLTAGAPGVLGYRVNSTATSFVATATYLDGLMPSTNSSVLMRQECSYPDGTSNTILLTECYCHVGASTTTFAVTSRASYSFTGATVVQSNPTASAAKAADLQSPRPAGILVALMDGSARLVTPAVFLNPITTTPATPGATWEAACTPSGGEVLGTDW